MPAALFPSRPPGAQPSCSAARAVQPGTARLARLGRRTAAGLALTVIAAAALPSPASPASRTAPAGGFTGGEFNGVSSVSAADAWAVGSIASTQGRNFLTLAAHWDGTRWARVPSPSPGEPDVASLTGVSAASAADAWAVGYYGTFGLSTLVLHWDGTRWARVPSPNPGAPAGSTTLAGVSAVSASSAWAVGTYGNTEKTLILGWNGTRWAQVPSPSPGGAQGSQLLGVTSVPQGGAWAVGCAGSSPQRTLALQWTGTRWTQAPTPNPGVSACLTAVTAVSPSDVWAVGSATRHLNGPYQALVLHWDGARWTRVASPSPRLASTKLTGVSAASAADAWAVGGVARHQVSKTFVLHWDGTCWTRVASPSQGASVLNGVSGTSPRNALAAGSGAAGSLALRWNGSRWVIS
jgi:hypothetical protein